MFDHDPALVESIRQNAHRFHGLFEEVVDELVREYLGDRQVTDNTTVCPFRESLLIFRQPVAFILKI